MILLWALFEHGRIVYLAMFVIIIYMIFLRFFNIDLMDALP